jgi:NADPH2 dehydrogenase
MSHAVESRISGNADIEGTEKIDFALDIWGWMSPILVAGGFKPDSVKKGCQRSVPGQRWCYRIGALLYLEPRFAIQAQKRVGIGAIQSGYILEG